MVAQVAFWDLGMVGFERQCHDGTRVLMSCNLQIRGIIDSLPTEKNIMNHATPALILWLILSFILWALPRALTLAVALTGEVMMFLFECAVEVYGQGRRATAARWSVTHT